MSQAIIGASAENVSTFQSSEAYPASQGGGYFTLAKDTKVVSSTNLADIVDLPTDGQKMLQTLLSGGGVGAGRTNGSAGPGSVVTTADGMTLSITTASARTIGRQQDSASSSDEMISWQTADGKSGTFEVEETDSFTTDLQGVCELRVDFRAEVVVRSLGRVVGGKAVRAADHPWYDMFQRCRCRCLRACYG